MLSALLYIYRSLARIDPQAKPFPNEPTNMIQSNECINMIEMDELSDLGGEHRGKTPFEINLFHTFTIPHYFPKFQQNSSYLATYLYSYSPVFPQNIFPNFTSVECSQQYDSWFHDVPRSIFFQVQNYNVSL